MRIRTGSFRNYILKDWTPTGIGLVFRDKRVGEKDPERGTLLGEAYVFYHVATFSAVYASFFTALANTKPPWL